MNCRHCGELNEQTAKKCKKCKSILVIGGTGRGPFWAILSILILAGIFIASYFLLGDDTSNLITDGPIEPGVGLFAADGDGSDIHGAIHRIEYGDNVVYLFGTMHAAAPDWFPLNAKVEEIMRRADVFAFESDLDMENIDFATILSIMPIIEEMHMSDQTLADVLPSHIYENLVRYIGTFGMTYEEVYNMNPVALAMNLEVSVAGDLMGESGVYYDDQLGVDGYLMDFAARHGVATIGLEPLAQQMRIAFSPNQELLDLVGFSGTLAEIYYDTFTDFVPRAELVEMLLSSEDTLYAFYLNNDIQGIIDAMQTTSEEMENAFARYMTEVLMNFRSTYYAHRIAELLTETDEPTTFFVAVGLSHVVRSGDYLTNIVEQLELFGIIADPIWREFN